MIVLDTNVISELFRQRPDPQVMSWLELLTDDVAITTITLAELLAGVQRLPEGKRKVSPGQASKASIHGPRKTPELKDRPDRRRIVLATR